jgi:hypothetical protein
VQVEQPPQQGAAGGAVLRARRQQSIDVGGGDPLAQQGVVGVSELAAALQALGGVGELAVLRRFVEVGLGVVKPCGVEERRKCAISPSRSGVALSSTK